MGVVLLVTSCHMPPPAAPSPDREPSRSQPTLRVLSQGAYGNAAGGDLSGSAARQAIVEIATTPETYRLLWGRHVGGGTPPAVDFASESVVFLFLGMRPTGGYAVEPQEASVEGGVARVKASVRSPGPGEIVTMAFTAPYAVVAISSPRIEVAEWIDRDGKLIARAERRVTL